MYICLKDEKQKWNMKEHLTKSDTCVTGILNLLVKIWKRNISLIILFSAYFSWIQLLRKSTGERPGREGVWNKKICLDGIHRSKNHWQNNQRGIKSSLFGQCREGGEIMKGSENIMVHDFTHFMQRKTISSPHCLFCYWFLPSCRCQLLLKNGIEQTT